LACYVILNERDLDEVLDSQERMPTRRNQPLAASPEGRRMLKEEYARTLSRVKEMLARRPHTELLVVHHRHAISDSFTTAEKVNRFPGGGFDTAKMASAIDPSLYRSKTSA
jgi:hypothetical protein